MKTPQKKYSKNNKTEKETSKGKQTRKKYIGRMADQKNKKKIKNRI